jgi:hypothetical protein
MGRKANVPEGLDDRSLARSAWKRDTKRIRPVGNDMKGLVSMVFDAKTPSEKRRAEPRTQIGDVDELDQTVPYGTDPLCGLFPGTSCQATIVQSLRDRPLSFSPSGISPLRGSNQD